MVIGDARIMHQKKMYEIDGSHFSTLEGFYDEISRVLIPEEYWGCNLDAFNDILRGGFGTPEEGFILQWKNSTISRQQLGYPETIRQLTLRLEHCHPSNKLYVQSDLEQAKKEQGATVFDWLVEIIQVHCQSGKEEDDGVELLLA
ncbi:MAG: barstar family protein [Acidobacteriota bacterium]|nr:barstar family protein [Acidobacteriota bacterium]